MGREVKRVDIHFDWPIGKVWFGYELGPVPCDLCYDREPPLECCPLCYREGRVYPKVEPPAGEGWQMWETVSEGSPISPVLDTAEGLARWLVDNNASAEGVRRATYEQWLAMIHEGWSPSLVLDQHWLRAEWRNAGSFYMKAGQDAEQADALDHACDYCEGKDKP